MKTTTEQGMSLAEKQEPGKTVVQRELGEAGWERLRGERGQGGALGALADLVVDTAREADSLAQRLTRLLESVGRDLGRMAEDAATRFSASGDGFHQQEAQLLAVRCGQQLRQLGVVLEAYRAAVGEGSES